MPDRPRGFHPHWHPQTPPRRPRPAAAAILPLAAALFLLATQPVGLPPADAAAERSLSWPGDERSALSIPDPLWKEIRAQLGLDDRPLGYTAEQMAHYGRDRYRLRTVENLFRDVAVIPRMSGRTAEGLVANAHDPADLVQRAFLLTDISAGRNLPMLEDSSCRRDAITGAEPAGWRQLPAALQCLVARICGGAAEAAPWLRAAYAAIGEPERGGLETARHGSPTDGESAALAHASIDSLYAFATAPWTAERLGQYACPQRAAIDALGELDRDYLAFGSVILLTHLRRALEEYHTAVAAEPETCRSAPSTLHLTTALGAVRILGPGSNTVAGLTFLTVDLGGDDRYLGRQAVSAGADLPISILIDLAGDDTYEGGDGPATIACGLFGCGVLIDLAGNDHYHARESGLGAAWYGTGVLLDQSGDDTYVLGEHWGQGMATAGVGLLVDLAGHDRYTCGYDAQGYGATYGAGVLLDIVGNDRYIARDDGNISALYLNQSVSMAQGVGQGRRADLGDGHSLAGGFGVLVDGAGDDLYHATAWSQGAGYWWAVGILEDLGGDDHYRNGKYSLGAGAHFAIGCQVDLRGNDLYNVGNAEAVNQFQGHARDGSIGVSLDGDGDDQYLWRSHCGGSGDLASIGFFWDRRGDDCYRVDYTPPADPSGWNDTPPMGTTTCYAPFHSWRDDLTVVGIFLDTGGCDRYRWPGGPAGNGQTWRTERGTNAQGLGSDIHRYERAAPPLGD